MKEYEYSDKSVKDDVMKEVIQKYLRFTLSKMSQGGDVLHDIMQDYANLNLSIISSIISSLEASSHLKAPIEEREMFRKNMLQAFVGIYQETILSATQFCLSQEYHSMQATAIMDSIISKEGK